MYGILLAAMSLLGFPPFGFALVSLLIVAVGAARIVFRWLNHPRLISMGTGLIIRLIGETTLRRVQGLHGGLEIAIIPFGIAYGVAADFFISCTLRLAQRMRSSLTVQPVVAIENFEQEATKETDGILECSQEH